MRTSYVISLLFIGLFSTTLLAQEEPEKKGFGVYKEYDKSFIGPNLRGKHSVSIGGMAGVYGPSVATFEPKGGVHFGYNYLVLERRKVKLSSKGKFRNEVKFGLGLHCNLLSQSEFMLMGTFYRPLSQTKGKFLSWYFLGEYGLGLHKTVNLIETTKPTKLNLSIEVFRLRFGKLPAFLHLTFNYDIGNDFLDKERLNIGFLGGFRYYIFKP